jgi:hypothetical protein
MEFKLSQSKLQDFENMCPMEFKSKHITKNYPPFEPTPAMEWGNFFETKCIGGGINGAFSFEKSVHGEKMKKSVTYERVLKQVEAYKKFKHVAGFKVLKNQEYISGTVIANDGVTEMYIEGTLDIEVEFREQGIGNIDLKLTGDTENGFGKFAWGAPETMDLVQIKHYALLLMLKHKLKAIPHMEYWVFDTKADLKTKLIKCHISEEAIWRHKERLYNAWARIQGYMVFDEWEAVNTWENCSKCKAPCQYKREMPEYTEINL